MLNDSSPEKRLAQLLTARGETAATAESCTGGLIGHRLTNLPGSSAYYLGGVVAYSDAVKTSHLDVPAATLVDHGAVSEPTALAMAVGVRDAIASAWAIAVTGIAGPDGGTPEKPVGLVWVAYANHAGAVAKEFRFQGDRQAIKELSADAALNHLITAIEEADRQ